MVSQFIRRHILCRPPTQIITTRELLVYGSRRAVDQTTYLMVKCGFLIRLAWGVFVRSLDDNPTVEQIVTAKMSAFGKLVLPHGEKLLMKFRVVPVDPDVDLRFAINAHSSNFWTRLGRVYLKGIGPRKVKLCKTPVGQVVYALWHRGYDDCDAFDVGIASRQFGRKDREEFRMAGKLMPAWLNEICTFRYPDPKAV